MAVVKITKNMTMGELIGRFPYLAEPIMLKYGLHCVGYGLSTFETIEQGALSHGISKKELIEMIKHLNSLVKSNKSNF